jgi:quercetin dioxygenase-like cupin family protein
MRLATGVLCAFVGMATPMAQESAVVSGPSKTEPLASVNLAEVGLAGSLTAGRVTIAPGIARPDHTHTMRTSLLVVVQGTLTEVRGSATHDYHVGDVVAVPEGATHHAENHGSLPLVYVEINATASKK